MTKHLTKQKTALLAADLLARAVVYGPLFYLAAAFVPMAAVPLAMAAAQPWFGQGLAWGWAQAQRHFPKVTDPLDRVAGLFIHMKWWKHASIIIVAVGVAMIPVPGVVNLLPHFVRHIINILGGADSLWAQNVLPFALATGLPYATKLATEGFDWIFQKSPWLFQKIPVLREFSQLIADGSMQRQTDRRLRRHHAELVREIAVSAQGPKAATTRSVKIASLNSIPGITALGDLRRHFSPRNSARSDSRRLCIPVREVNENDAPLLPSVIQIATPSRVPVPAVEEAARGIDPIGL